MFTPYKNVGQVTGPCRLQQQQLGNRRFLCVSAGDRFVIVRADSLSPVLVSPPLPREPSSEVDDNVEVDSERSISGLSVRNQETLVVRDRCVYVYRRTQLVRVYRLAVPIACHCLVGSLLVLCERDSRRLVMIDVKQRKTVGCMPLGTEPVDGEKKRGEPVLVMHPKSYLNKLLVVMDDNEALLINVNSRKVLYSYSCFKRGKGAILCVTQTPFCADVCAVGYSSGQILFVNLLRDTVIMRCTQDSPVTDITFRDDSVSTKVFCSSSSNGFVSVWSIETAESNKVYKSNENMDGDGNDDEEEEENSNKKNKSSKEVKKNAFIMLRHRQQVHDMSSVSTCQFFQGEPVLLTSSAVDNSIKLWMFDSLSFEPKLFKSLVGHRSNSTRLRFINTASSSSNVAHNDSFDCELYSIEVEQSNVSQPHAKHQPMREHGVIRFCSLVNDRKSREFGFKNINKNVYHDDKLPTIVDFDFCDLRDTQWGNLVSIHKNHEIAYIWNSANKALTNKVLIAPDARPNKFNYSTERSNHATAVCVSSCGNFCVVGYRNGLICKFNLQSCQHRGNYPSNSSDVSFGEKHNSDVTGLFIDVTGRVLVSCGHDGRVIFWDFITHNIISGASDTSNQAKMLLRAHKDAGFVAVATFDHSIELFDVNTRKLVRRFEHGHSRSISDIAFTPDNRSLISASLDCTLRVWDFPSGRCLAWYSMENPITSLAISPSSEYICVSVEGQLGFSVFINRSLYEELYLNEEPTRPTPMGEDTVFEKINKLSKYKDYGELKNIPSRTSNENGTIVLSSLPRIYCTSLFHLELIRKRSEAKVAALPKTNIPFFLSEIGKTPIDNNAIVEKEKKDKITSRILKSSGIEVNDRMSGLSGDLIRYFVLSRLSPSIVSSISPVYFLFRISPSAADLALQSLCVGADDEFGLELLCILFACLKEALKQRNNFEAVQALLYRTLINHESTLLACFNLSSRQALLARLVNSVHELTDDLKRVSRDFRKLVELNLCLLRVLTGSNEKHL